MPIRADLLVRGGLVISARGRSRLDLAARDGRFVAIGAPGELDVEAAETVEADGRLVLPGVIDTPMAEAAALDPTTEGFWPKSLNMPTAWVVWAVFAAVRLKLAEVAVPPGGALLEKLGALAPGATDVLVRGAMGLARRSTRRRTN